MKKTIILTIVMLFITSTALAFNDICKVGAKALRMTSAQTSALYNDEIKGRRVQGSGSVYDVSVYDVVAEKKIDCRVVVSCGNNVFVNIYIKDCWGSVKYLKVGQKISFTADCKGLRKKYYRDSNETYVEAMANNASLNY